MFDARFSSYKSLVITVVESREGRSSPPRVVSNVTKIRIEKLDLLKVTLGQSIVARQSAVTSSKHRTILFVVE